jgi:hypothetical protein
VAPDRGDWNAVHAHITKGLTLSVDDSKRRSFLARQIALLYPGPASPSLHAYFFGSRRSQSLRALADAAVDADPAFGLAHYLAPLQASVEGDHATASREMVIALDLGLPGTLFVRNAARLLLTAGYRAHDTLGVERAIDALTTAEGMTEMDGLLAQDWRERLAFDEAGALPAP